MLKRLFWGKFESITGAAIVISIAGFLSRILGMVRDRVLAGEFGAGAALDMYYAAFRVPDLIYNIVIFGAISAGFIPIFTSLIKNKEQSKNETDLKSNEDNQLAWNLMSNVINVFSVFLIIATVILFIYAKPFVKWLSPGFTLQQINITTTLTKIMFFSPILLGLSGIVGGALQSFKRFFVFSLAPIMYNVGIIIGAWLFVDWWGIYGLAWGVVLGALLHLLVQLPVVHRLGYRYRFIFNWRDRHMLEIMKLMVPRILGLVTTQINLIVITIFGSMVASGSIAIFNLANNLQSLPVGLIGVAFAVAAFPTLSGLYANKDNKSFNSVLSHSARMILFTIIPITVLFLVLRLEIVRLVLGVGRFNWHDTQLTANALGMLTVSLFAQALIPLLARAFFARHNTWMPLVAGISGAIVNLILAWQLTPIFDLNGLTLAFSISGIVNLLILFVLLRRQLGDFDDRGFWTSFLKIIFASGIMGGILILLRRLLENIFDIFTISGLLIFGFLMVIIGAVVYWMICSLLRCVEISYVKGALKRKFYQRFQAEKVKESINI